MKLRLKTRLRRLAFRLAVLPVPTRLGWYFFGAGLLMFSAGTLYLENSFLLLASVPAAQMLLNALAAWLNPRRAAAGRGPRGAATKRGARPAGARRYNPAACERCSAFLAIAASGGGPDAPGDRQRATPRRACAHAGIVGA